MDLAPDGWASITENWRLLPIGLVGLLSWSV